MVAPKTGVTSGVMTASTEQATGPALNGAGPAPDDSPAGEVTSIAERLMGVVGLAFAIGLALIGLDLMTGGAVARVLTGGGRDAAGAGG